MQVVIHSFAFTSRCGYPAYSHGRGILYHATATVTRGIRDEVDGGYWFTATSDNAEVVAILDRDGSQTDRLIHFRDTDLANPADLPVLVSQFVGR